MKIELRQKDLRGSALVARSLGKVDDLEVLNYMIENSMIEGAYRVDLSEDRTTAKVTSYSLEELKVALERGIEVR
jgi:hypothetical protein